MRGLAGLVLLAVACSSSGGALDGQGRRSDETAGAAQAGAGAPQAGAVAVAGSQSAAGADDDGEAGSQASAGAPAGGAVGSAGSAGQVEVGGASAQAGAPAGGASPVAGSGGAAQSAAGQGGAPGAECSGFTTYTVDVNTCLAVTGDFQQQTDPACSPALIVSRDHCSTCASWGAPEKPTTVMLALAVGATMKRYDAPGGVCPSDCKYICN